MSSVRASTSLQTNNMPILTTLQHWDHGFQSPFKSEVYFVNTTRFNDQKWGTKNPIMARDPEFGPVRLRAFGTYSMRVSDPGKFITEIVGTDGEFTTDEISIQIRNIIVQAASQVLAGSGIPVLDMAANTEQLGQIIAKTIAPKVADYGLTIPEFYVENISLPEEVEKALDKRTSMGVVGDLNRYMQYNAAEAMAQPGSAMGQMMGAGMAAGMGAALGQSIGPWGSIPAAAPAPAAPSAPAAASTPPAPPPPPPAAKTWHIAEAGQTTGPFAEADLAAMVASGALTRATMVWTTGQDGWKPAAETELSHLLAQVPPPPPPVP
jgi:membrane protease subunit (stomatin/prohibitin family)